MLNVRYPGHGDESRPGDHLGDTTTAILRKLEGSNAVPASAFAGRAAENGKVEWLVYFIQREHTKRLCRFVEFLFIHFFKLPNLDNVINGHNPYPGKLTEQELEDCFMYYVMQMVNEIADNENLFQLTASVEKAKMKTTSDSAIVSAYQNTLNEIYNQLA